MGERFVSEPLQPADRDWDAAAMAAGAPGLPAAFRWRGQTLVVQAVLRGWRETGPCRHGSGERYVRKHWFEVLTDDGRTVKLYFERQPRRRGGSARWWLYTIADPGGN